MSYFGYSQLALYKTCPRRYWHERIEKRPEAAFDQRNAFIGSLLGGLVARFYSEQWYALGARAKRRMLEGLYEVNEALHATIAYPWQRGEWQQHMDNAIAALDPILTVIAREQLWAPRIDVELQVTVPLPTGDILTGTPDLVFKRATGEILLLDAKAGASVGRHVTADQLRLYQLGVATHPAYGRIPDKVGFWWLRHGKIVWKRTPKDALQTWLEGVQRTLVRLKVGDYDPTPNDLCRFCPFRGECPRGMEGMQEVTTRLASDDTVGTISL